MADRDLEKKVVGPGFHAQVYAIVRQVPRGHVTTYGDIATILGSPRVARHVGWALAGLGEAAAEVPWHRVINSRGTISYKGDTLRAMQQEAMLLAEGVALDERGKVRAFAALRWGYPGHVIR